MGSLTTEIPASATGTTAKRSGADTLENEAIGLDVSVRVHGSQVTAVVLESTEHVEPFEEDTSTMIVFSRGAVVKLQARVRTGHAVVLTNLATKQTALCRIIQVNSTAGTAHYVKLEFSQPEPGFWGVHFPSDPAPSAAPSLSALGTEIPARETRASIKAPQKAAELPNPLAPTTVTDAPSAVRAQPLPAMNLPQAEAKPGARETIGEGARSALPLPMNYGASPEVPTTDVVPLAAAPVKDVPIAPKAQAAAAPPQNNRTIAAVEAPIFDSLSTGEEIFGKEAPAASLEPIRILRADMRAAQAFGRSLDPSLLQSVEIPKRHSGLKIFLTAAAVVIIGAGATFYVRQYQRNARQNAVAAAPAPVMQRVSAATSNPAPDETTAAQTPAPPNSEAAPSQAPAATAQRASVQAPADEGAITVTPVHSTPKSAPPAGHPTISTGLANIYAGDLAARPQANKRRSAPVQAPAPAINSSPGNLGAVPSNAALGSLVGGSADDSALPKPAEAKPIVRGGVVTPPRLIRSVQPIYPALATSNHTEGNVQVEALIDQSGKVVSTKVISGPILLRRAAMDAVRQWRYSPALLDGKPISMQYKVTVSFRLGQ